MLLKRLVTAAIGIPLFLAVLFTAPPAVFLILILILFLIGTWEAIDLVFPQGTIKEKLLLFAMAILLLYSTLNGRLGEKTIILIIVGLCTFGFISSRTKPIQEVVDRLGRALLLTLYTGILFALPAKIWLDPFGKGWVLLLFMGTWAADSGAYVAGRIWGKHKLLPVVSPGKTLEGVYGGIVVAVIVVFGSGSILANRGLLPPLPGWQRIVLGIAFGLFGVGGDLFESLLKRSAGKKDSGALFPGHGGVLDRFDALLFNGVLVWVLMRSRESWM